MRWGWGFGFIFFVLFFSLATAQTGTLQNDSPTPLGGFTTFTATCPAGGFPQELVVCDEEPCDFTSSPVCISSPSLSSNLSCSAPSSLNEFGLTTVFGACCNPFDHSCVALSSTLRTVGFDQILVSGGAVLPSDSDYRQNKVVRRGDGSLFVAYEASTGAALRSSTNNGDSWSAALALTTLVSASALPSGVSLNSVKATQANMVLSPNGNVNLVFTVQDSSNGNSAVFYSTCPSTQSCVSAAHWSSAVSIVSASTITEGGKWKYRFARPQLAVRSDAVHVVFDDAQPDQVKRIPGLFHYWCEHTAPCSASSVNWKTSTAGPELLGGGGNGYPREPSLARNAQGKLGLSWVDYSVPNNPSSAMVFFSLYDELQNTWSASFAVLPASGNFSKPLLAAGDSAWVLAARNGSFTAGWRCTSNCTQSIWSSLQGEYLSGLSQVSEHAAFVHPATGTRLHILSGLGPGESVSHIWGSYVSSTQTISPRKAGNGSSLPQSLTGISDAFPLSGGQELVYFTGYRDNIAYLYVSDALDAMNAPPSVTVSSPSAPEAWNKPAGVSIYTENVSFLAGDGDSQEVYASIYLGVSPTEKTYPVLQHAPLSDWQAAGGLGTCSGSGFSSAQNCAVDVTLFSSSTGAAAPDGTYYVIVELEDSDGGTASDSSVNPIQLGVSALSLVIQNPTPNSAWASNGEAFRVIFNQPTFATDLKLGVQAFLPSAGQLDAGVYTAATYEGISPTCQGTLASLTCDFTFLPTPDFIEGKYNLTFVGFEDGFGNAQVVVQNVILDFFGPVLLNPSPSGIITAPITSFTFSLEDYSTPSLTSVSVNGASASASCVDSPSSVSRVICTVPLSEPSTGASVIVRSVDGVGNTGESTFSFGVQGTTTIVPPKTDRPIFENFFEFDSEGNLIVVGTPIVIPRTVVDAIFGGVRALVLFTTNLIEIVGPSAIAFLIAFCALAGVGSDHLFRQIFVGIKPFTVQQRERVMRTILAGIFMGLPLFIGLYVSLPTGFIFAILEFAGFIGGTYLVKMLQYYEIVGFTPIAGEKNPFLGKY